MAGVDGSRWQRRLGVRALTVSGVGLLGVAGGTAALANFVPWWLAAGLGLISGVLGLSGGLLWQRQVDTRDLVREWERVTTAAPVSELHWTGDSILVALNPDQQIVRFNELRRGHVRELRRWCTGRLDDGRTGPVWLIESAPGDGKTRLLIELVAELDAEGWVCGWVKSGHGSAAVETAGRFDRPVLLVVDDADLHLELPDVLTALARSEYPHVRLVAAAREFGEWWSRLRASLDRDVLRVVPSMAWTRLEPLTSDIGTQRQMFGQAIRRFAGSYEVRPPVATLAPQTGPTPVVLVHAAAVIAVHDQQAGRVDVGAVLHRLFAIEEQRWRNDVAENYPTLAHLGADALAAAVTAAVLVGADSADDAVRLLAHLPRLGHVPQPLLHNLALWLYELYPQRPDGWLSPHLPARLVEHYIAHQLAELRPLATALADAAVTLGRAHRLLTTLAYAARHTPAAVEALTTIIGRHPTKLIPMALSVALAGTGPIDSAVATTVMHTPTLTDQYLQVLNEAIPYPTEALSHTGLAVARRLSDHSTTDGTRAGRLHNLSIRFDALGQHWEALQLATEAVAIQRRIAASDPDTPDTSLALFLGNLSSQLHQLGRRGDALVSAEEAVAIYRRLAVANPDAYAPGLAEALRVLSVRLDALGRYEEALAPVEEAVAIYQRLALLDPDANDPDLANSLGTLSNLLGEMGRRGDALVSAEEAVAIYRRLAVANPDAYAPGLAEALRVLSVRLDALGRYEEALPSAQEAVGLWRRLAAANPIAHESELANSLNTLSILLGELERYDEVLAPAKEGITIVRRLAAANPVVHEPHLAASLSSLSVRQYELGRYEEAVVSAGEAVAIFERLTAANCGAYADKLAICLHNLSIRLNALGRYEEALTTEEKAVAILRRLYQRWPDAINHHLARAEAVLRDRQAAAGRTSGDPLPLGFALDPNGEADAV